MDVRRRDDAPRNERGGQVSHLLLTTPAISITWVRGEPGSQQRLHAHAKSEQVYVIIRGRGLMLVGDEEREVEAGTAILIPAGAEHAIRNVGLEPLEYVSATTPGFAAEVEGDTWRSGLEET